MQACTKLKTPYGVELRWRLPGGMFFHIHLKDNLKVKAEPGLYRGCDDRLH